MAQNDVVTIRCACCRLPQRMRNRDGGVPNQCGECERHQGSLEATRLRRAESHEEMLRVRLYNCRASEQLAQEKAKRAELKASSFWRSRGRLAERLINATEDPSGLSGLIDDNIRRWTQGYRDQGTDWRDD